MKPAIIFLWLHGEAVTEMKMSKQQMTTPLAVRVEAPLREWLKYQARCNQRSLNKEIAYRLEQSKAQQLAKEMQQ